MTHASIPLSALHFITVLAIATATATGGEVVTLKDGIDLARYRVLVGLTATQLTEQRKLAATGDAVALDIVLFAHVHGLATKPDLVVARTWLDRAVTAGGPIGVFYHARRLAGSEIDWRHPRDSDRAISLAWRVRQRVLPTAAADPVMGFLAGMASLTLGEPQPAHRYLLGAATQGFAPAARELGKQLGQVTYGDPVKTNAVIGWLKQAADRNDPHALCELFRAYRRDRDLKAFPEARNFLMSAAKAGLAEAGTLAAIHLLDWEEQQPGWRAEGVHWLQQAAASDHREAQANLGWCLATGAYGLTQNLPVAVSWWQRAAEQQQPYAQAALGLAYRDGRGIPADPVSGQVWLQRAAESGSAEAAYEVAVALLDAAGAERDVPAGLFWLRRAASGGDDRAIDRMQRCYRDGIGTTGGLATYRGFLIQMSRNNGRSAVYRLDHLRRTGKHFPDDHAKTLADWFAASRRGDLVATVELGRARAAGVGGPPPVDQVPWKLWERAAATGNLDARYLLADGLRNGGTGRMRDAAAAMRQLEVLALAGQTEAMYDLARAYAEGVDVNQDTNRWRQWAQRLADAKDPRGLLELGASHGVDSKPGLDFHLRAAEAGNADAISKVIEHYSYLGKAGTVETERVRRGWLEQQVAVYGTSAVAGVAECWIRGCRGKDIDIKKGIDLLTEAAVVDGAAARTLANLYRYGVRGPPEASLAADPAQQARWLKTALVHNPTDAGIANDLAELLFLGRGVPRDPVAALTFSRVAANHNLAAMERMALIYEQGAGTDQDRDLAAAMRSRIALIRASRTGTRTRDTTPPPRPLRMPVGVGESDL